MAKPEQVKQGAIFEHFKTHNLYRVLDVGLHTETEEDTVAYVRLHTDAGEPRRMFFRPLDNFCKDVEVSPGEFVPRFAFIPGSLPFRNVVIGPNCNDTGTQETLTLGVDGQVYLRLTYSGLDTPVLRVRVPSDKANLWGISDIIDEMGLAEASDLAQRVEGTLVSQMVLEQLREYGELAVQREAELTCPPQR